MEPADTLAVTMLAARYAHSVDRRDATRLASLLTPEVVLVLPPELNGADAPSELTGRQEVVDSVLKSVSRFVVTRHVLEQQTLETISRDGARGEAYCTAHHIYSRDGGHRDARIAIRYQDTLTRDGDTWLFSRRELVVDFIEDVPVTLPAPPGPAV